MFVNCGMVLKRRSFIPQVTLGGLKKRHGKAVDFHELTIFLEGEAGAITLYRSKLTPYGAVHMALAAIPLGTLPKEIEGIGFLPH